MEQDPTQSWRVANLRRCEDPPHADLTVRFEAEGSAEDVLERARPVMAEIARAQDGDWPDDEAWLARLPAWFVVAHDPSAMEFAPAWDSRSWLEVMRWPGWQWWSSCADGAFGTVRLEAFEWPFSVGPLVHLLRVAGAMRCDVDEGCS